MKNTPTMNPLRNDQQLLIIYNRNVAMQRQSLAYAKSFAPQVIEGEVHNLTVSSMYFSMIACSVGKDRIFDAIDKKSEFYKRHLKGEDFSVQDLYDIIRFNPEILMHALVYFNGVGVICFEYTDIDKTTRERPGGDSSASCIR